MMNTMPREMTSPSRASQPRRRCLDSFSSPRATDDGDLAAKVSAPAATESEADQSRKGMHSSSFDLSLSSVSLNTLSFFNSLFLTLFPPPMPLSLCITFFSLSFLFSKCTRNTSYSSIDRSTNGELNLGSVFLLFHSASL